MPARRAAKPRVKVIRETSNEATPPHMVYYTKFLQASIGHERNSRVKWKVERPDGSTGKIYDQNEGVTVSIGEKDWQHSGVYLGIQSKHRLENGHISEGSFGDFVSLRQLGEIIHLLQVVRAKANELGILTPRPLPKARPA